MPVVRRNLPLKLTRLQVPALHLVRPLPKTANCGSLQVQRAMPVLVPAVMDSQPSWRISLLPVKKNVTGSAWKMRSWATGSI